MTVRIDGPVIRLEGDIPVEEAEALVRALLDRPSGVIDWTGAARLHSAVVQVVLLAGRPVRGPCGDPFLALWIEPNMVAAVTAEG